MQIKDIKRSLPHLFQANITPLLIGPHGIGKTESVRQFARDNGYMLKVINLGTLSDSGDLLGLADFVTDKSGKKIATSFITPDWIKEVVDYAKENPESKAVIFLDEVNRAHPDLIQSIFSLVLEKRIHTLKFPDNVVTIAGMNPPTGDYVTTDISDKAFMNRFLHIKVSPSVEEWVGYARENSIDRELVNFITVQPDLLDAKTEDFNLDEVKPSRRSWEAVDRLLKTNPPEELVRELKIGLVGTSATIAHEEYLKSVEKPLTADDVLLSFDKHKKKITEQIEKGEMDLLKNTSDQISDFLKNTEGDLDEKRFKNLKKFYDVIPSELALAFMQTILPYKSVFKKIVEDKDILERTRQIRGKV